MGHRYFDAEDYENAMIHFQESVDVIERFMIPGKAGYDAYLIGGTHANHAITLLNIAACLHRLGRTDGIDALVEKAKRIYFYVYDNIEIRDYDQTMNKMLAYFRREYDKNKLNDYKPLDLSEIEKRIAEKGALLKKD